MTNEIFSLGDLELHYCVLGDGKDVVLAFHGFGQTPDVWERWSSAISPNRCIISIGLFGHGTSSFPQERIKRQPLEKEEWSGLIAALLSSRGIERVEVWGYSMGCRMAMGFIELKPNCVHRMLLFAPDGLKRNLIYRFACETAMGRWLFHQGLSHAKALTGILALLARMRLMPHRLSQFIQDQLASKHRRGMVYESWLIHRRLFPGAGMRNYQGHGIICFGAHDAVIPPALKLNAARLFSPQVRILESPFGHRMLTSEFSAWLEQQAWWV